MTPLTVLPLFRTYIPGIVESPVADRALASRSFLSDILKGVPIK